MIIKMIKFNNENEEVINETEEAILEVVFHSEMNATTTE